MDKITKDLLRELGAPIVENWSKSTLSQYEHPALDSIQKKYTKKITNKKQLSNALHYLKRNKYIEVVDNGKTRRVILTTKGAVQYVKYCDIVSSSNHKDDKHSLIIIEIPEAKRELRDFLRRRLLDGGFKLYGRGVYTSKNKLNNNFNFLVKVYGLENYIKWGTFEPR